MATAETVRRGVPASLLDDPRVTERQPQAELAADKRAGRNERCAHRTRNRRCTATGIYTLAGFPGAWCERHAGSILAAGRRAPLPHTPATSAPPLPGQITVEEATGDATTGADEDLAVAVAVAVMQAGGVLRGSPTPRPAVSDPNYRTGHCTLDGHPDCPGLVGRFERDAGRVLPLACACPCHPNTAAHPATPGREASR